MGLMSYHGFGALHEQDEKEEHTLDVLGNSMNDVDVLCNKNQPKKQLKNNERKKAWNEETIPNLPYLILPYPTLPYPTLT